MIDASFPAAADDDRDEDKEGVEQRPAMSR